MAYCHMKTKHPILEWNGNRYYTVNGYWGRFSKAECGKTITTLMHREVMASHICRPLKHDEVVHHKDRNPKNNDLSNLELMSWDEHSRHHGKERVIEQESFICGECGKSATKLARNVRGNTKKGREGPFCSRSCAGKRNQRLQKLSGKTGGGGRPRKNGWTDEQVISRLDEGKSVRAISREIGASTYSIQKIKNAISMAP